MAEPTTSELSFPEHFDGKRFYNPDGSRARGFLDVLRWKLTSRPQPSPRFVSDVRESTPFPSVAVGGMQATFVNHSTVLLQQNTLNILTDPIWSERASPFSRIGPARHRSPGIRMRDLPRIDLVLLSHNHYDHLDLPTLQWLARRGKTAFVVPLGVAPLLRSEKIEPVSELDWGESLTIGGATIHSVPALHFSGRGFFDRNRTLWCGYVISTPDGAVYFAGDTAFGDHFADIRKKFGAPQLGLLPIGAYKPGWFMSSVHMSPDEAVEAHRILGCRASIAIHHGTFQLADDGIDTARREIAEASAPDSFLVLKNGESVGVA